MPVLLLLAGGFAVRLLYLATLTSIPIRRSSV
jgi:hypothetical protein